MFVSINKSNDRYFTIVGANPNDNSGAFFNSMYDFYLIANMPSSFSTFAEAYAAGQKIATKIPSLVMAKKEVFYSKVAGHGAPEVESEMVASYESQLMILKHRFSGLHSEDDSEKPELYEALRSECEEIIAALNSLLEDSKISDTSKESFEDIIQDLQDLIDDIEKTGFVEEKEDNPTGDTDDLAALLSGMEGSDPSQIGITPAGAPMQTGMQTGMPSGMPMAAGPGLAMAMAAPKTPNLRFGEIIQTFGEAAATGLIPSHPEAFLRQVEWDDDDECFYATVSEPAGDLITLAFNYNLLLYRVLPHNRLHKQCSYQSPDFFEKYWEPIIHSVGHFFHETNQIILVPEHYQSQRFAMRGFRADTKSPVVAGIQSAGLEHGKSWIIKCAQASAKSGSTQNQLDHAQIRCTKRELPTYFGRTGLVKEVRQHADYTDVVVDFGRGLDVCVLTDQDVEIIGKLQD